MRIQYHNSIARCVIVEYYATPGRAMRRTNTTSDGYTRPNPPSETTAEPEVMEQKGDLLIRDLWQQGTDSFHNIPVVNTDTLTYLSKMPEKCPHEAENSKNKMPLEACLQQRRNFSPLSPR